MVIVGEARLVHARIALGVVGEGVGDQIAERGLHHEDQRVGPDEDVGVEAVGGQRCLRAADVGDDCCGLEAPPSAQLSERDR